GPPALRRRPAARQRRHPHLRLDRPARQQRRGEPDPPGAGSRRGAGAVHVHPRRGDDRPRPLRPAGGHPLPGRGHRGDRPVAGRGGPGPGGAPAPDVPPGDPAADAAGRRGGCHAGLRAHRGRLRHAGAHGRPVPDRPLHADLPADDGDPRVGIRGSGSRHPARRDRGAAPPRPPWAPPAVGAGAGGVRRGGLVLGAFNALVYAFLLAPILVVVVVSFGDAAFLQFPPRRLSLRWYRDMTEYPDFVAAFWLSLLLAAATTAVS